MKAGQTMPIPKGWRFLSETELVRGNFKVDCKTSYYARNESVVNYNENLELIKRDLIEDNCWYFDSECDGFFYSCLSNRNWVNMFDTKGARSVSVKNIKSFWKVVEKQGMKENNDGSIEYGKVEQMTEDQIKKEIYTHVARINELKELLEKLKSKRFDLPGWLGVGGSPLFDNEAILLIVEDFTFQISCGVWFKHQDFDRLNTYELEETTFEKLIVGDWFLYDPQATSVIGIIEKAEFGCTGVKVFDNGQCFDFSDKFLDEKYYKIVPKS